MVLMVGGSFQGKTERALKRAAASLGRENRKENRGEEEREIAVFDGRDRKKRVLSVKAGDGKSAGEKVRETKDCAEKGEGELLEELASCRVILHMEALVKHLLEAGAETEVFAGELVRRLREREAKGGEETVLTADEIGCGIVPADASERVYREQEGRFCQKIAAGADSVYRVVCGLEMKIK